MVLSTIVGMTLSLCSDLLDKSSLTSEDEVEGVVAAASDLHAW
jgi:hypothetical protein